MNLPSNILCLIFVTLIFGCTTNEKHSSKLTKSDTTQIIKTLIDSSYYNKKIADINYLDENNSFGDSIILEADNVVVGKLPDTYKIKILTIDDICSMAINQNSETKTFSNFLKLEYLRKTNTGYEACIRNIRAAPLFDKAGRKIVTYDITGQDSLMRCEYGLTIGAELTMNFKKNYDTLISKILKQY